VASAGRVLLPVVHGERLLSVALAGPSEDEMSSQDLERESSDVLRLRVTLVPDAELDAEAADRLTRRLRTELAELDVESVALAADGSVPDGAKAADPVTLGAIVVALSASGGVFTVLIDTVRDWLGRSSGRHRVVLTIGDDTIELDRATAAQQRDLVEAYIRRHTDAG
jgi:hypothetical protein